MNFLKACSLALLLCGPVHAGLSDDPRFCGPPARYADGTIKRSSTVLRLFEKIHPRPQDGRVWRLDHPYPLACGGCDSIENLQWLPYDMWLAKSKWERVVYGGNGISPGCP